MAFHATFLYPNGEDLKFDKAYYLLEHMPLMQKQFVKHGLRNWEIVEYKPDNDGVKPPYILGTTLVFETSDQFSAALASDDAKPVFADMPNYTNKQPVFLGGHVVRRFQEV